ncbi:MAG: competence protein ComEA helix-hairpin-helix repeat protein [Clostridia bacterium]|jgi:competence protein ComEA|nr:competence protein ComEA helix-hairpin-helix repeat protein [Clostridia bacterium]
MIYNFERFKKYVIAIILVLLIICGIVYKNTVYDTQVVLIPEVEEPLDTQEDKIEEKEEISNITVYVCGNVKDVRNVTLPMGSRVEDAIKLAGGVTADAEVSGINMAQKLSDEDMVYVPKKGEIIDVGSKNTMVSSSPIKKNKLNINKASAQELDALPGVGPSIAQKIVEYRSSKGGFKSIEELNNVSGIGEEKYKDMKDLVTID